MTVAWVPKASAGSRPLVSFDPDTEPDDEAAADEDADVELEAAVLPPFAPPAQPASSAVADRVASTATDERGRRATLPIMGITVVLHPGSGTAVGDRTRGWTCTDAPSGPPIGRTAADRAGRPGRPAGPAPTRLWLDSGAWDGR